MDVAKNRNRPCPACCLLHLQKTSAQRLDERHVGIKIKNTRIIRHNTHLNKKESAYYCIITLNKAEWMESGGGILSREIGGKEDTS